MIGRNIRQSARSIAVPTAMLLAAPAFAACTVADTDTDLGSQSPQALKAAATPYLNADGGFSCATSSLSLLADNFLRATVASGTVMTLTGPGGGTISYVLAGMADGTVPLNAGATADYIGVTERRSCRWAAMR